MGGVDFPFPVVAQSGTSPCPDDLTVKFPEVFHTNGVTHAMVQKSKEILLKGQDDEVLDLSDSFIVHPPNVFFWCPIV